MHAEKNISLMQFSILIINMTFGANMLMLPRSLAEEAKENMWLTMLLGSLLIIASFYAAVKLCNYFPHQNAIEYHLVLAGPVIGAVLNVYLIVLMIMIESSMLRIFRIAVKGFLLDMTPSQVITGIMLLVAVYVIQDGLGPIVRFQQFVFESGYLLFLFIMLFGLLAVETQNFQPFLAEGFLPVVKGVYETWSPYSGAEILIGFLYPYLSGQKNAYKFGLYGIGFITILYVVITVIVQGILGPSEIAHNLIPTIMAFRSVEVPGTFIERIDGYLLIVWISIAFVSVVIWLQLISFGISQLLKIETTRPIGWLIIPLVFYIVSVPPNIQAVNTLYIWINWMGLIWGLGVLPLLWGIAWFKLRRNIC